MLGKEIFSWDKKIKCIEILTKFFSRFLLLWKNIIENKTDLISEQLIALMQRQRRREMEQKATERHEKTAE